MDTLETRLNCSLLTTTVVFTFPRHAKIRKSIVHGLPSLKPAAFFDDEQKRRFLVLAFSSEKEQTLNVETKGIKKESNDFNATQTICIPP